MMLGWMARARKIEEIEIWKVGGTDMGTVCLNKCPYGDINVRIYVIFAQNCAILYYFL